MTILKTPWPLETPIKFINVRIAIVSENTDNIGSLLVKEIEGQIQQTLNNMDFENNPTGLPITIKALFIDNIELE